MELIPVVMSCFLSNASVADANISDVLLLEDVSPLSFGWISLEGNVAF